LLQRHDRTAAIGRDARERQAADARDRAKAGPGLSERAAADDGTVSATQLSLLEPVSALPEGFVYQPALVAPEQEIELIEQFRELDFHEFEFQGYLGRRRVVSFGLHYDFAERRVREAAEISAFLLPLRDRAAGFAGLAAAALEHALVTEYTAG